MAIEEPKLSAILSIPSIPLFSFFVGKSAKIRVYPGMKKRKGNPNIIRIVLSIGITKRVSKIVVHTIHRIISIGYLVNMIFIVLLHMIEIISDLYKIRIKKIKKNTKIEKYNRFLRRIGKDSDTNSYMTSNPISIRIKIASMLKSVIIVIKYTIIVQAIIIDIINKSEK
jgi:hypothetical protein